MNYIQFAFRNILRHRRRSFVTIMTVCLGFTALGVMGGMVNNIFSRLKAREIVVEKLGHITFAKPDFFEKGKIAPEKYLWTKEELQVIMSTLKRNPGVVLATPRLRMFGIASNGNTSTIFITEATVPEDDASLIKTPIDGRTENPGAISLSDEKSKRSAVAIGSELSKILNVKEGDFLTLLTTTKDGVANAVDVDIAKVFNTGNPATDDKYILTNFSLAQELYDTDGAERIVVTVKNPEQADAMKDELLSQLASKGIAAEAQTWDQQSKSYTKVKTMFGVIFRVLTIIISVIVLLTILNTMQMAVAERTREIGTLRAIGMLRSGIVKVFCVEGIIMGIAGCLLAIPFLFLISTALYLSNASFTPPVASTAVPLVLIIQPPKVIFVFILFCVASTLSSFIVSRRISKQNVVDSLSQFN